jgi:two-component system, OmpR family, sensor histidine kinase KdpD
VPGSENTKRHQDVAEVLAAGIDVYSTLNVQHVESLAGQIARCTGAPVRETVPDRVLHGADDVVLVDVTPELLIERLKAGKVYVGRPEPAAESGFFRPDTLATLREISLLEVTQEAESGRQPQPRPEPEPEPPGAGGPTARPVLLVRERPAEPPARVLALATPDPWVRATVYHAFRTAERLHAPFDVLWVRADDDATASQDEVAALERLIDTLGGSLIQRSGDLVAAAAQVARERGSTYLLMGRPTRRNQLGRLAHGHLPLELMSALPEIDLQIVALPDPKGLRRRDERH